MFYVKTKYQYNWWFTYATLDVLILSYFWSSHFLQLDFEGSLSPVIAPKKARPSETGSDEVRNGSLLQIKAAGVRGLRFFLSFFFKGKQRNSWVVHFIWAHPRLQTSGGRKVILPCAVAVSCDLACQGLSFREVGRGNECNTNYKATPGSLLTMSVVS